MPPGDMGREYYYPYGKGEFGKREYGMPEYRRRGMWDEGNSVGGKLPSPNVNEKNLKCAKVNPKPLFRQPKQLLRHPKHIFQCRQIKMPFDTKMVVPRTKASKTNVAALEASISCPEMTASAPETVPAV